MEPLSRMAPRDGLPLSVLHREGEPTVLFLHGLAGYGGEWLGVCRHLDDSLGLLLPDQRGHGLSGRALSVDRSEFVRDAVGLVEKMASNTPVVVVGHSMGGIVATLMAGERPDLLSAVVLIETGMEAMTRSQVEALQSWLDAVGQGFASEREAQAFFGGETQAARAWVEGLEERHGRLRARFDPDQMANTMRNLASEARWSVWESIDIDTTLVTASSSAIGTADVARMVRTLPASRHVIVRDSGHDVHLDQPGAVADIVSAVIARVR